MSVVLKTLERSTMNNVQLPATVSSFSAFDAFTQLFDISLRYASMFGVDAFLSQTKKAQDLAKAIESNAHTVEQAVVHLRDVLSSEGSKEYQLYASRLRTFSGSRYAFHEPDSLDRPLESDDSDICLRDVITSRDVPEETAKKTEMKRIVSELFATLSPEERQILTFRFGLNGNDSEKEMPMVEIGDMIGAKRSSASKRCNDLLKKCRIYFEKKGLKSDDFF